jgi:hypothetical protein
MHALLDHADVLSLDNRPAEALSAVEGALRLYARKGDAASVERARAIRVGLSA